MSRMNKDEMEKYRAEDRQQEANSIPLTESQQKQHELEPIEKGVCIIGEARKDREDIKPIELYEEAERTVKNLEIRLAESLEVNEAHQKINGKLQERLTEVEEENKKMHDHLAKQVAAARKGGM